MISRLLLALSLFFLSAPAPAREASDGRDGNGGTEIGFEVKQLGARAVKAVTADPAAYPELKGLDLAVTLEGALVLVSPDPLFVVRGGQVQECTAKNIRGVKAGNPDTILVSRPAWEKIRSEPIKQALALHEVLGLAGVESTGDYRVSNRYLRSLGVECPSGLCDDRPEAGFGPMRFHAVCHGAARGACVNPPDSARTGDRYPVIGGGSCEAAAHDFVNPFEWNDDLDDRAFTCDAAGVQACASLTLRQAEGECRKKGLARGSRQQQIQACILKAREESRRNAPLTGIATDGRCYISTP